MKRMGKWISALGVFLFALVVQADWTESMRLTNNSGWSMYPAIAVDLMDRLHVVCEVYPDDMPDNSEIYYMKSADGGTTWTSNIILTSTLDASYMPDISADPLGNLHLVWAEGGAPFDIYYMESTDIGATWTPSTNLSSNTGLSYGPRIIADSFANLHVVWHDDSPGYNDWKYEIFNKKYIQ